jgi:ABC-type uncharacterized transport system involved in gliding motility auxiliary subunit
MNKKQASIIYLLSIIAIIMGIAVSGRIWFRIDTTKNKAYTISPVSRNLHSEISDPVTITYYVSDKLRAISPMPGEIEDLLREFAAFSRGKIRLSVRDPVKAHLADQIEQLGILPQQIQTMEQDQASFVTVYTGIVIECLDETNILPVVFSLETLEYDLASRIRDLVRGSSRQLGVIVGDNPRGWNQDYAYLQNALTQAGYNIRLIAPGEDLPDTLSALMVLGGVETFDETALYQIDRYIQAGGKALFTVRSVYIETEGDLAARLMDDKGLLAMLSSYGVTVLPQIGMDRSALTMQYQTRLSSGAVQFRIVPNPQWVRIRAESGSREHPVSAHFAGLDLFWPNPLQLNPPEQVEAVPLFTGTAEGWAMNEPFNTNPEISYLFERDASTTKGEKVYGISLTGIFPSYFKDRPQPVQENGSALRDMPETAQNARILVVGEQFFAASFLGVTGARQNLDFMLQAAGWLGNDDDIIAIRSRQAGGNRLDKIIDADKRAAAMRFAQIVNVIIVPLVVIAAGLLFAARRRSKAGGAGSRSAGAEIPVSESGPLASEEGETR